VLVKPGDRVKKETPLITLESEKASMEVPSTGEGVVESVNVKVGDKVSKGTPIVTLSGEDSAVASSGAAPSVARSADAQKTPESKDGAAVEELKVPDIGDFHDVPVIEVLIKPGDAVRKETPLVTLESEKASMEVPSTNEGTIQDVRVNVGDRVSKGTVIATVRTTTASGNGSASARQPAPPSTTQEVRGSSERTMRDGPQDGRTIREGSAGMIHASPAVRRFARELGVDIHGLNGSGPHGRITREDVQGYVKRALRDGAGAASATTSFAGLPPWPKIDFAQFGPVERKPLPRIKKFSGPNLHRNWLQIPHITNYDEADVTELEAFRNEINAEQGKSGGAKLTMLAFLIRASVAALKRFPDFNSSLEGEELIYKRYYNIGFAADTPNGLVVPVLKDADAKGLLEIARETADLAAKARDGKLGMAEMQGSTFTISSIGGIGGTQFTQIVNAPEVAILGATRATMKPVWDGKTFEPRLMLPVSVSYDHRVIDGAGAARFLVYFASLLRDFKRVLL
jgi:pyruvate dehydrogenase E2 component (dihydrolipoamide acetyltransferase)